jgi:hypothetical protein
MPHKIGETTTRAAGEIIFLSDAVVAISMHLLWSGKPGSFALIFGT